MHVLKVVAEGSFTSFRYPHFIQKVHPTFEMPPPATIYGHIASVLGDWFDPTGVQFAYHFTYQAKGVDLEHVMMLRPSSGKLKGTDLPKVMEGNINPFEREVLFNPKLVLYINRPDWLGAFRSPRYPVALGRSQDLFMYTDVRTVTLQAAPAAYFEHTLLPYNVNRYTARGYAVTMPRYLDYTKQRQPQFDRYFVVQQRLDSQQDFLQFGSATLPGSYWVDAESPAWRDLHLGLTFLGFTAGT